MIKGLTRRRLRLPAPGERKVECTMFWRKGMTIALDDDAIELIAPARQAHAQGEIDEAALLSHTHDAAVCELDVDLEIVENDHPAERSGRGRDQKVVVTPGLVETMPASSPQLAIKPRIATARICMIITLLTITINPPTP